ncbi:alpha/beta hydrolase [Dactylosporangium sp. CA-092794]|uniref:alpha/beta hydrolase n=1 Tax=Dactylosporangium sp. CA-092794 TaxID=3239929 RepID=UPI003D8EAA83
MTLAITPATPRTAPPAPRPRPAARHLATLPAIQDLTVPGGPLNQTWLRIFRPASTTGPLPVIVYVHGTETPFADPGTRRKAFRLATNVKAAVILVDYSLAPTARVPIALEEDRAAVRWATAHGTPYGLDGTRIALASDPSAATRAEELILTADRDGDPVPSAHVVCEPGAGSLLRAALAA